MKEFGRKPYISKTYHDMMNNITDKQIFNQVVLKHSEMKKPYLSDDYSEMEHYFSPIYPGPQDPSTYPVPWYDPNLPNVDTPWMSWTLNPDETTCEGMFDELFNGTIGSANDFYVALNTYIRAGCPVAWIDNACSSATIKYTTTQMAVNETQQLTATGEFHDWFINGEIKWELDGGGALSSYEGETVIYTAPGTNAECADNATISLICNGTVEASLTIAINAVSTDERASAMLSAGYCYVNLNSPPIICIICKGTWNTYKCDGSQPTDPACTNVMEACGFKVICHYDGTTPNCSECYAELPSCCDLYGVTFGVAKDLRTADMITAGCCPSALL